MWCIKIRTVFTAVLSLYALLFWGVFAVAGEIDEAKPFADKHVVLQISDADPAKQTLVLNVANNLLIFYGPDRLDLEVVAFGPGLRLLLADNANGPRIESLVGQGVRFSACENTIRAFTKALGKAPELNPHAVRVSAGVVRIIDLTDQGYVLIKP
jgi:intracellular sulfur oxidation DsrE/DsrF family protein